MIPSLDPDRHWGCRLNDRILWRGMRALILQNELLQIVVLVDKGAEIIQFLYKPQDIDFLWHSLNRLREPASTPPVGVSPADSFFDLWTGGWFEVLPNGGPACTYKGADLGTFSEVINVPWGYRVLEDDPAQVSVLLWVRTSRTPFQLQKILTLKSGEPVLRIQESVVNHGAEPVDFMWGHHPVVGPPFLDQHCRLYAPPCKVQVFHDEDGPDHRMGLFQETDWPYVSDRSGRPIDLRVIPPPIDRTMDNCYLKDFTDGWIAVNNHERRIGFGLAWDPQVFRYVWLWEAFGGGRGYPWYGRTYNLGLEPWTSYPCVGLARAVKMGTAMTLGPGDQLDAWLTAVAFPDKDEVREITRDGDVLT